MLLDLPARKRSYSFEVSLNQCLNSDLIWGVYGVELCLCKVKRFVPQPIRMEDDE